jgi:Pyruvate/2-oxoacid:ferredoxin oxidoreductase gamma subunit
VERAVIMTGLGGQGIQLMAKVLAQGAIREGREVMSFGLFKGMIRGGSSEATVVIAEGEIVAPPIVPHAWAVLAMHPEGLAKLAPKAERGGVLVFNATLMPQPPAWDGVIPVAVPATEIAKREGQPMGAGMILLGALAAATGLAALASLQAALGDVLPPHRRALADANRRFLEVGAGLVAAPAAPAWAH